MSKLSPLISKLDYRNIIGKNFYYFSLIVLVVGLPLSPFLTSMAQMWLGINWILEGQFKKKLSIIKTDKRLWLFVLLPLIHVLGLWNTSDFAWAFHDLKIKVPLLVIPVIIATSETLEKEKLNKIFWLFTWALFSSSLISIAAFFDIIPRSSIDIRSISLFISHIRFALMIVLSMVFLAWNFWYNYHNISLKYKIISIALVLWFSVFISILQSLTSWVIFIVLIYILFFKYYKTIHHQLTKIVGVLIIVLLPISIFTFINYVYHDYYKITNIEFSKLPTHTPRGNKYYNDTTRQYKECGNYMYILISEKELAQGWEEVSEIPFKTKDANGFSLKHRLIRYLTSLNLPKDLDGIRQLDEKDIQLIEKGYASSIYKKKFKPYIKVYETIYELDHYFKTGNANNKSISMRIEFFKTGLYIAKNHLWLGVGTGDIKNEFSKAYKINKTTLKKVNRKRTHNQYLSFVITFGLIGFIFCLLAMLGPLLLTKPKSMLLIAFSIILFFSMLNEDTLETQAGVTFYILFYALLVYNNKALLR